MRQLILPTGEVTNSPLVTVSARLYSEKVLDDRKERFGNNHFFIHISFTPIAEIPPLFQFRPEEIETEHVKGLAGNLLPKLTRGLLDGISLRVVTEGIFLVPIGHRFK